MLQEFLDLELIQVGTFQLKNGDISKYYFDMRRLISYPDLLSQVGDKIYQKYIQNHDYDVICAVPLGGVAIATYISTRYNIPMIIVREEQKEYGMCQQIEGDYNHMERCLIIDDVLTSGNSIQRVIDTLKEEVTVVNSVVIVDRQEHTPDFPYHALFTKTDIVRLRLQNIIRDKNTKLCFAADHPDTIKNLELIGLMGPHIAVLKVHYDLLREANDLVKQTLVELSILHNFLIMQDSKFVDISSIVSRQYQAYKGWVDVVTVHGSVHVDVIKQLAGCVIVANMSNNNWDLTTNAISLANAHPKRVIGFVTQKRINLPNMLCMTPGVTTNMPRREIADQKYRNIGNVDTDIVIVGRAIYNAEDPLTELKKLI